LILRERKTIGLREELRSPIVFFGGDVAFDRLKTDRAIRNAVGRQAD
jgi:hypothetical protein